MSKQVDFYLIENHISDAKYKLASHLSNKLLKLKKKTLIVTDSAEATQRLDHWLWSFNGTSFVSHGNVAESSDASLIHIGDTAAITNHVLQNNYSVLITLCESIPAFSYHFTRIAEIIEQQEEQKTAGRLRYKNYHTEGFTIKTHSLEL